MLFLAIEYVYMHYPPRPFASALLLLLHLAVLLRDYLLVEKTTPFSIVQEVDSYEKKD